MNMKLSVESDLPKALEKLKGIDQSKWPRILADAANEAGYYALNKYKQQMPSFIDRPTPFTLNSMYLKKATPSKLEAVVEWREFANKGTAAGKYLKPLVEGGDRRVKRFERALQAAGLMPSGWVAIPTDDAPKNNFGNVPGGLYNQILSYLRANPDAMQNRRAQKLSKMKTGKLLKGLAKTALNYQKVKKREVKKKEKASKYFTVQPKGGNSLPPGIYERVNLFGGAIRRLFFFARSAQYRVSFPFYDIGKQAAIAKFPVKLDEAIAKSINQKK